MPPFDGSGVRGVANHHGDGPLKKLVKQGDSEAIDEALVAKGNGSRAACHLIARDSGEGALALAETSNRSPFSL